MSTQAQLEAPISLAVALVLLVLRWLTRRERSDRRAARRSSATGRDDQG